MAAVKRRQKAERVIEELRETVLYGDNIPKVVTNVHLLTLYRWKHGKNPKKGANKREDLIAAWKECRDYPVKNDPRWLQSEEEDLTRLKNEAVTIKETELERQVQRLTHGFLSGLSKLSGNAIQRALPTEELASLKSAILSMDV